MDIGISAARSPLKGRLDISRTCAAAMVAGLFACVVLCCAPAAFADAVVGATHASDPSTAEGNATILGEGAPNTLNSGRIWADKSVYTGDVTVDGVTVSNDSDFLVVFSALGSSTARTGDEFDGVPNSPIGGPDDALTFSDPLGEYLEPTSDVTLIQFGQEHAFARTVESDSMMRFSPTNDQTLVNLSYGDSDLSFKLSDIVIVATKDEQANRWTMSITIPSRALPLYLSILEFGNPDANGNQSLKGFSTNAGDPSSLPLRIAYSIGIPATMKNADGTLDFTKVSSDYQAAHTIAGPSGSVLTFTSNYYDDPSALISPDETMGNSVVTVVPADDNNFYYFQDHLTIYRNGTPGTYNGDPVIFGTVSDPVLDLYELQSNPQGTFYVSRNYFRKSGTGGLHSAYEVVAYSGRDLMNAACYYDLQTKSPVAAPGPNVVVATNIGCACLGGVAKFRTKKTDNVSDTAAYSYFGEFIVNPTISGAFTIEAHYGNNGVMSVAYGTSAPLELAGEKRFELNGIPWTPGGVDLSSFEFRVLPNRANPSGDPVSPAGLVAKSEADGTVRFVFGTYAQPGMYSYDVREVIPATSIPGVSYDPVFFTVQVEAYADASGTIRTRVTLLRNDVEVPVGAGLAFANRYDADAISMQVQGQVHLNGATLAPEQFAFALEAVSATDGSSAIACPMPSVVTASNGASGLFVFGPVTFTQPGRFVYRVHQSIPADNSSDYRLDRATYLVTITVRYSDDGALYATSELAKDGVSASSLLFENAVNTPTLSVRKTQSLNGHYTGSPATVKADDVIGYTITVSNPSSVAVRNVLLYDEIPAGLLYSSVAHRDASGPYLRNGRLYWIIRELGGGESFSVSFAARVPAAPAATLWTNLASVAYPDLLDEARTVLAQSGAVLARYEIPPSSDVAPALPPEASADAVLVSSHGSADTRDGASTALPALVGIIAAIAASLCAWGRRRID